MLAIIPLPLPLRLPLLFLILSFLPIFCFGTNCIDLKCPAEVQATKDQMDLVDNKLCRDCEDCFHSGYSYSKVANSKCNSSNLWPSIRDGHHLIIDQFWHTDYWKGLRPEQLYLFYEFPVSKKEHCEANVQIPTVEDMVWINARQNNDQPAVNNSGLTWLCKASLRILMSGIEREEEEESEAQYDQHQQHVHEQTVDAKEFDEHDESNSSPEVKFERDVFAGAKRVRFHYELMVHRDNLLVRDDGEDKPKFESQKTLIKSDPLDFDLYPNINGKVGKSPVNVEQDKPGKVDGQPTVVQPFEMMEENGTMESAVGTMPMPTAAQQEEIPISSAADAEDDHPTRTDWLLLRNIIIFMLFLLAIFLALCIVLMLVAIFWAVAFCHKRRGMCYFPNGTTVAAGKYPVAEEAAAGHQMTPI